MYLFVFCREIKKGCGGRGKKNWGRGSLDQNILHNLFSKYIHMHVYMYFENKLYIYVYKLYMYVHINKLCTHVYSQIDIFSVTYCGCLTESGPQESHGKWH